MEIPNEIIVHILQYVPPSGSLFAVSKRFQEICTELYRPKLKHLIHSIFNNRLDIFNRIMRDPDIDPSCNDNDALLCACKLENIQMIGRLLLDKRVNPASNYNILLSTICKIGDVLILERLLQDERVDPSMHNGWVLDIACQYGHIEIVKRLLQHPKIDPTINKYSALRQAIRNNDIKIVDLLLKDPRMDEVFNQGTIIDMLDQYSSNELIMFLLQDQRTHVQFAYPKALYHTLHWKNYELSKELLTKITNIDWEKTLEVSCVYSSISMIEYILYTYHIDPFDYPNIFNNYHIMNKLDVLKILLQYPSKNPNKTEIIKSTIQIYKFRYAYYKYCHMVVSTLEQTIQLLQSYI